MSEIDPSIIAKTVVAGMALQEANFPLVLEYLDLGMVDADIVLARPILSALGSDRMSGEVFGLIKDAVKLQIQLFLSLEDEEQRKYIGEWNVTYGPTGLL